LIYILAGLAALMIIGCVGLTALGIVVGAKTSDTEAQRPASVDTSISPSPAVTEAQSSDAASVPPRPEPTQPVTAVPAAVVTTVPAPAGTVAAEVELPPTDEPVKPAKVKVPNLKGRNAAEADDVLRKLGFTNIDYGSRDEFDTVVLWLPNWTVKKQSVKPGARILPDTKIVLTCTKQ
jgi:hypothetical protein